MELRTEDFLMDPETASARRLDRRFENLYAEIEACNCNDAHDKLRGELFLIKEAEKILLDSSATKREQVFARAVYEILSQW